MTKKQLKEYCDAEFENIVVAASELSSLVRGGKSDYSTAELAAIATFIHNCYNGVENVLKRLLYFRQKEPKDSPTWHKDLLKASFECGIVGPELNTVLSNYLAFRHFFVHAYSFTLRWENLKPLAEELNQTLQTFRAAIYSCLDKLET